MCQDDSDDPPVVKLKLIFSEKQPYVALRLHFDLYNRF